MQKLNPQRMVILSFLCAICAGTVLLSLPAATRGPGGMPFVDSLFTATSATCVTGLIVRDTGTYFTAFGKAVIFALFQIGALGIMTFSTLFAVVLGRKIGLREDESVRSSLNELDIVGIKKLIGSILGITITIELAGAALLYFRWRAITDWPVLQLLERAVFHSVSAFCNAGFALFKSSFIRFEADPVINLTMIALIVTGGIGFVVIMDILRFFFSGRGTRKISLQAKIAISTSLVFIFAGALLLLFFERDNVMRGMSLPERIWGAFFQSVTARTAGFNSLPIATLTVPSIIFIMLLMFIGASPGSTGGGIKTCTFTVVAAMIWSMLRGRKRVMMFNRSVPRKVVRESLIIVFVSAAWIFVTTIVIAYLINRGNGGQYSLVKLLFEVVSAFGTVGLSTGVTGNLDAISKLFIVITMLAGRVGPLTLALAVAFKERSDNYVFPEENLMVG